MMLGLFEDPLSNRLVIKRHTYFFPATLEFEHIKDPFYSHYGTVILYLLIKDLGLQRFVCVCVGEGHPYQ